MTAVTACRIGRAPGPVAVLGFGMTLHAARVSALLAAALLLGGRCEASPAPDLSKPSVVEELDKMNLKEELSEDLAAAMVDMGQAYQERDMEAVARFLAPDFQGDIPFAVEPLRSEPHPGFELLEYPQGHEHVGGRQEWLDAMRNAVGPWRRLEDVTIKVKAAEFSAVATEAATATLRLEAIGVGPEGERRSTMLLVDALVRRRDASWEWVRAGIAGLRELRAPDPPFLDVSRSAGVGTGSRGSRTLPLTSSLSVIGRGAAALDFDGDGRMDIFAPAEPANYLYRNRGDGTFEDVAEAWGAARPAGGRGTLALDFDNDGRQDLLICSSSCDPSAGAAPLTLLRNTGARFEDVSERSGIRRHVCATSAAAADYDGDGLLDIYVCAFIDGRRVPPRPSFWNAVNAEPNLLFHNLGDGRFEEVGALAGVDDTHWSLSAVWDDFNADGRPDLFVVNDRGRKRLYRNEDGRTFRDVAAELGAADPGFGMGGSWGDHDGDGDPDLYISNMSSSAGNRILKRLFTGQAEREHALLLKFARGNTLLELSGSSFTDVTSRTGTGLANWAWGNAFLDADNDGWLDLFVANGNITGKSKRDT